MVQKRIFGAFVVLVLSAPLGCEGDKKAETKGGQDAGAPKSAPGVDPDLAAAMRDVAGAAPAGSAAAAEGQPPPTGVFAPGMADKELASGAPPKLTVGGTGNEPRIALTGLTLAPKKPREMTATVSVRTGPRAALPTIELRFKLDATVPKTEGAPAAPAGIDVAGKVTSAKLAADQPGRLPEGLEAEVKKMSGSKVTYATRPDGSVGEIKTEMTKDVDEGLGRILASAAEYMNVAHLPFPKDRVGAGAFWMITTRERYAGLDVVAYRMVRVERIEGENATVSVNTKRYVAGGSVDFPGIPPHRVVEFRGEGRGELVIAGGKGLVSAQLQDTLLSNLEGGGGPDQKMGIQLETTGMIAVPGG